MEAFPLLDDDGMTVVVVRDRTVGWKSAIGETLSIYMPRNRVLCHCGDVLIKRTCLKLRINGIQRLQLVHAASRLHESRETCE